MCACQSISESYIHFGKHPLVTVSVDTCNMAQAIIQGSNCYNPRNLFPAFLQLILELFLTGKYLAIQQSSKSIPQILDGIQIWTLCTCRPIDIKHTTFIFDNHSFVNCFAL